MGTNVLEIVEVRNLSAAIQLLKRLYTTRYIRNEIEPMIQDGKLPLRFPSTNLYFCIGHLHDAHINGWMTYNLYPGQDEQ